MENGVAVLHCGEHTERSVVGQTEFYLFKNNPFLVVVVIKNSERCPLSLLNIKLIC